MMEEESRRKKKIRGGPVPAAAVWICTSKSIVTNDLLPTNSSTYDPHFPRMVVVNEDLLCM